MTTSYAPTGKIAEFYLHGGLGNGATGLRLLRADHVDLSLQPPSKREREVLSLVAEGYSNKLIAARLTITERTVKNHLANVMTKLRAFDRTHAVVTAVRLGWLAI